MPKINTSTEPRREIHFWADDAWVPSPGPETGERPEVHNGWAESRRHIYEGTDPVVHTTQMGLLSTDILKKGWRVIVHGEMAGDEYEIRLGSNDCTEKEIRPAHNLFRMWQAGAFLAKGIRDLRGERQAAQGGGSTDAGADE